MKKRPLGSTGFLVGEIGMGCEGFAGKGPEEIRAFLDVMETEGINLIDLYSSDPELRSGLGKALEGRRERFLLQGHLCTIWRDGQYKRTRDPEEVRQGFEDLLARLNTSQVEVGMIHYVDSLADWETVARGAVMAYAQEQKALGRIRCIGLSSHNPEAALAAVESGLIQVLMFSVNPCYDLLPGGEDCEDLWKPESYQAPLLNMDPAREALYEACSRRGVGITVMKAFGGGDLLSQDLSPAGKALTPWQCIHYALDRPGVASVMAGARTLEELRDCAAYETASRDDTDYATALASLPRISWKGHCMYCGHCAPCPSGIDVASVTKFLNLCRAQGGVPETVREHYAALAHGAGECIRCGACQSRCPFGVPVMENMAQAKTLFGR
jgi:predicted aldo/keto reductase-like oxidoreductase